METMLSQIEDGSSTATVLQGFAYGEFLEGPLQRSLGFRLLAPHDASWCAEVEALARKLQATSYPDEWPVVDLFASVLLADGQRLIALARFGITDRTPSQRRGGLELFGVVGPNSSNLCAGLAIDRWLRHRRAHTENLEVFAICYDLVDVLAEAPSVPLLDGESLPSPLGFNRSTVLPATNASEPDTRLGLLAHLDDNLWQWLPFVPADFPLEVFAERGPIIAWSTPLAKPLLRPEPILPRPHSVPQRKSGRLGFALLGLLLIGLLGANAWYLWQLDQRLAELKPQQMATSVPQEITPPRVLLIQPEMKPTQLADNEALVQALYHYLRARGCIAENRRDQLLKNYERLAAADDGLRVGSLEGRLALGALNDLTRRKSPAQIEAIIRGIAGEKKGIDDRVLELIAEKVYQRLSENGE